LGDISLGGLQRVQFEVIFFHFFLDVCGEVARPLGPLDGGFTIGLAINTC
jgi:hypothetical protein